MAQGKADASVHDEGDAGDTPRPEVGVLVVGHGHTASQLLAVARKIAPEGLEGVQTVDAGLGQTPVLIATLNTAIERADQGLGVVMMVDLYGASPCTCGLRERAQHELVVVSGLNLAMLLKLASLDRAKLSPAELARVCAESAARAVRIDHKPASKPAA
jgi:PTS system mannose-specific IIA component